MMEKFVVKHTGLSLWINWLAIAGLMKLGHYLMDGYKPLTAFALLIAASGLIAAIIVTFGEEYGRKKMHEIQR